MSVIALDKLHQFIATGKFSDLIEAAKKDPIRTSLYLNRLCIAGRIGPDSAWAVGVVQGVLWHHIYSSATEEERLDDLKGHMPSWLTVNTIKEDRPPRDMATHPEWLDKCGKFKED